MGIGNTLQTIAQNIILAVTELRYLTPALSSGQLSANTLVFTGFVRVTGISVIAPSSTVVGGLYDGATIAATNATNEIYPTPTAKGYYNTQMIFTNGLVYKPQGGEEVAIFYVRS